MKGDLLCDLLDFWPLEGSLPVGRSAWDYVGALVDLLGHVAMILGITYASWKFREPHERLPDLFGRARWYSTL